MGVFHKFNMQRENMLGAPGDIAIFFSFPFFILQRTVIVQFFAKCTPIFQNLPDMK